MSRKKICLALSDTKAEEWLMRGISKRDYGVEFVKPALYRSAVLDRVALEQPSILIISEALPGGGDISFDAVIKTIRTKYKGCRIIILAGKHEPGDPFLQRMVGRGVYDIINGTTINLNEVVETVFNPKDYGYAETLQGFDVSSAEPENVTIPGNQPEEIEEADILVNQSIPENNLMDTSILKSPDPVVTALGETEVLVAPKGIIFREVQEKGIDIEESPKETVIGHLSHPVSDSRVLRAKDNFFQKKELTMAGYYLPKIIVFTGARQGSGCTSLVINTAYTLMRMGKNICVIDAVWNEKSIFDRLRLPRTDSRCVALPRGIEASYIYKEDGKGSIHFMELITGDILPEGLISYIRSLSGYSVILIDMSLAYYRPLEKGLIGLSDKVISATLPDPYEMMTLKNYLGAYKEDGSFPGLIVAVNRSGNSSPKEEEVKRYFGIKEVFFIPDDNTGFIRASLRDGIYINGGKKKVIRAYREIAEKII